MTTTRGAGHYRPAPPPLEEDRMTAQRITIMEPAECTTCNRRMNPGEKAWIPGWKQIVHDACYDQEDR